MTALKIAKEKLPITELWRLRNWGGKPGRSCRVPYRKDRTPSGSVLPNDRLFHDFASGQTFDGPALLARVEGVAQDAACRLFIQLANGAKCHRLRVTIDGRECLDLALPPLDLPNDRELQLLADLRSLGVEACELAANRGHLFCATWRGLRCWLITDSMRRGAQLRRLDGRDFRWASGATIKAVTVRGSHASWPIGIANNSDCERIILCEGGGDFLAAYHFAVVEESSQLVQPVTMLGAAQRLATEALPRFKGKRVRIIPHLDRPGARAALRWESQLREVALEVHCFDLGGLRRDDGQPVKDLNDLTRVAADDFENNRELCSLTMF